MSKTKCTEKQYQTAQAIADFIATNHTRRYGKSSMSLTACIEADGALSISYEPSGVDYIIEAEIEETGAVRALQFSTIEPALFTVGSVLEH